MKKSKDTLQIALKFFSDELQLDFLSEYLGMECYDRFAKGDEFTIGPPHNRVKKMRTSFFGENRLIFNEPKFFLNVISQYIKERVISSRAKIALLNPKIEKELYIGMQLYQEWTPSICLSAKEMKILGELDIAFDVDIYFFDSERKI